MRGVASYVELSDIGRLLRHPETLGSPTDTSVARLSVEEPRLPSVEAGTEPSIVDDTRENDAVDAHNSEGTPDDAGSVSPSVKGMCVRNL
jgi:hypothetical protein